MKIAELSHLNVYTSTVMQNLGTISCQDTKLCGHKILKKKTVKTQTKQILLEHSVWIILPIFFDWSPGDKIELQIRKVIEDNLKIIFLISQQKHML